MRIRHLRRPKPVSEWWHPPGDCNALAFSPDGRALAVGRQSRTVTFLDPFTGEPTASFDFGVGPVRSLAYAPDGLTLAIAGDRGLVVVDVG